jgi:hypothetical protein
MDVYQYDPFAWFLPLQLLYYSPALTTQPSFQSMPNRLSSREKKKYLFYHNSAYLPNTPAFHWFTLQYGHPRRLAGIGIPATPTETEAISPKCPIPQGPDSQAHQVSRRDHNGVPVSPGDGQ